LHSFDVNLKLYLNYLIFLRLEKWKLETLRAVCNLGASKACCKYKGSSVLLWCFDTSVFGGKVKSRKELSKRLKIMEICSAGLVHCMIKTCFGFSVRTDELLPQNPICHTCVTWGIVLTNPSLQKLMKISVS